MIYENGTWFIEDEEGNFREMSGYEIQMEGLVIGCE